MINEFRFDFSLKKKISCNVTYIFGACHFDVPLSLVQLSPRDTENTGVESDHFLTREQPQGSTQ